jgi:hypothetical protein
VVTPRGSSKVLPKKLLCLPCRGLYLQRLGSALGLPKCGGQRAWGSSRHPCRGHSGAWDANLAEGDGANVVMDGATPGLGRLVPARTERGVESV